MYPPKKKKKKNGQINGHINGDTIKNVKSRWKVQFFNSSVSKNSHNKMLEILTQLSQLKKQTTWLNLKYAKAGKETEILLLFQFPNDFYDDLEKFLKW